MSEPRNGTWQVYLVGVLTTVALTLGGACYTQTNWAVQELDKSDKSQAVEIGVLKSKLDNLIETLREVRDDVKSIRNGDSGPR